MNKSKMLICCVLAGIAATAPTQAAEIKGEDFPRIDGSESTELLRKILVAKAFGLKYEWRNPMGWDSRHTYPIDIMYNSTLKAEDSEALERRMAWNDTHEAYENLIGEATDIIFVDRGALADEQTEAAEMGVELQTYSIGRDALIFLAGFEGEQRSFSSDEIRAIFSGEQTEHAGVALIPAIWPEESTNRTLFDMLVPDVTPSADFLTLDTEYPGDMYANGLTRQPGVITYTTRYSDAVVYGGGRGDEVSAAAIDGVEPSKKNIAEGAYPYTTEVYAVVRADEPAESAARQLAEYLASPAGQQLVAEAGYIVAGNSQDGIIEAGATMPDNIAINAADGAVSVSAPEGTPVEVYGIDGSRVAAACGTTRIAAAQGLYVVRAGSRVAKVNVR